MLLFPEGNERRLDPMAQRAEAVDAGMASGAQSNQEARLMDPGSAVMDRQFMGRPTAAAGAAVALQNLVAVASKAGGANAIRASNSLSTIRNKGGGPPRSDRKAGPAHRAAKRCALVARAGPGKAFYRRASGKR